MQGTRGARGSVAKGEEAKLGLTLSSFLQSKHLRRSGMRSLGVSRFLEGGVFWCFQPRHSAQIVLTCRRRPRSLQSAPGWVQREEDKKDPR